MLCLAEIDICKRKVFCHAVIREICPYLKDVRCLRMRYILYNYHLRNGTEINNHLHCNVKSN